MNKTSFAARMKEIGRILLKTTGHVLFHNGWVKLIAILISLVLWAGLISQDASLTRDKTWQNVNISVTGEDTLKRSGYIVVSDLEEMLSGVTVTAAVPQKQYDAADPSAYNLRVDLSRLKGVGTQELKIQSNASSTYGKVTNTVPSVLNVELENYYQRRIPVVQTSDVNNNPWYKEWYVHNLQVDTSFITVSGPKDLVKEISHASVNIDLDKYELSEGILWTTEEFKIINVRGEEIKSSLLEITTEDSKIAIDMIAFQADVLPVKSFDISNLSIDIQGNVKKGYKVISCKVDSPDVIKVAAKSEVLKQMTELVLDRSSIPEEMDENDTEFYVTVQKPSDESKIKIEKIKFKVEIERSED